MKTMTMLEEHEVFVTLIDGGRPAFWEVRGGRPVMMSYAVTAAGQSRQPGLCSARMPEDGACARPEGHTGPHRSMFDPAEWSD